MIPLVQFAEPIVGLSLLLAFVLPSVVPRRVAPRWAIGAALGAYAVVLIRTAWLSDDAFINFRTVDHFIHGHGLVFNLGERVQTYTSPLWVFVTAAGAFVTRESPYTTLVMAMGCSLAAVWLLVRATSTWQVGLLAAFTLTASKSFVDYSTSGLENPLTFVLLAAFLIVYLRPDVERSLLTLSCLSCLIALNRMDAILIVAPALGAVLLRRPWQTSIVPLAIGFSLLAAWEVFSIFYYGFPFPNTAYAKLNTSIPAGELALQGLRYFRNSLVTDPLTLSVIGSVVVASCVRTPRIYAPLAIGVVLYLGYLVKIGGDFMSGRHLSGPFFASVWLLTRLLPVRWALTWKPAAVVAAAALLVSPTPTFFSGLWYGGSFADVGTNTLPGGWLHESGIEDSRYFYSRDTGLLRHGSVLAGDPTHWLLAQAARYRQLSEARGRLVVVQNGIGILGSRVGDKVYILDQVALADPLLARLPARRDLPWRIGHFERAIPDGYVETLDSGQNRIVDPGLAEYYAILSRVVRGELFDRRRLIEAVRFNLGAYQPLVDRASFLDPPGAERAKEGPRLQSPE